MSGNTYDSLFNFFSVLKKLSSNRSGSYSPFSYKFLLERTLFENLLEYWEFLHEPRACTYWW